LDLLGRSIVSVAFDSEEKGARPACAGDQASDLRQTLISGASILIALGFDIDEVDLVLPLTDKPSSCAELLR
jgi:hypothetical protein